MKGLLLVFPVILLLAGCSNIRSKQLVGKAPVDLTESIGEVELSGIAGEWVDADGEVTSITVSNAKEGEVLYTSLDEDNEDEPVKLNLRKSEDAVFVNFPAEENGERMWLLMKVNGDMSQILVWEPDTELFRKLIAEGKIKGRNDPETTMDKEGNEVKAKNPGAVIDDPQGAWIEQMIAGAFGVVFDWKNPTVLRRRVAGSESASAAEGADTTQDAGDAGAEPDNNE